MDKFLLFFSQDTMSGSTAGVRWLCLLYPFSVPAVINYLLDLLSTSLTVTRVSRRATNVTALCHIMAISIDVTFLDSFPEVLPFLHHYLSPLLLLIFPTFSFWGTTKPSPLPCKCTITNDKVMMLQHFHQTQSCSNYLLLSWIASWLDLLITLHKGTYYLILYISSSRVFSLMNHYLPNIIHFYPHSSSLKMA